MNIAVSETGSPEQAPQYLRADLENPQLAVGGWRVRRGYARQRDASHPQRGVRVHQLRMKLSLKRELFISEFSLLCFWTAVGHGYRVMESKTADTREDYCIHSDIATNPLFSAQRASELLKIMSKRLCTEEIRSRLSYQSLGFCSSPSL